MFSAGEAYERFMGRWSALLAPRFVAFAGVSDGDDFLDVGCGTGAVTAAASIASTGRVAGVDLSAPYIEFARSRSSTDRVRFEVGDAQKLTFADGSFDRTVSMLNLNFLPDVNRALHEMRRVTRPGGAIAAAVWDYGGAMDMLRLFWDEAVALDPAVDVRDERHMPLCREGELARLWSTHELTHIVAEPLTIETRFASFDDYWAPFLEGQGPAGALVAAQSSDARERLRTRLRTRLLGDGGDRPILLRARAWAVRGIV